MAWGACIRNPATGSKQIDQNFFNLALVSKQTITSAATRVAGLTRELSYAEITINSTIFPIVAIACAYGYLPVSVSKSGNDWTFGYWVDGLSRSITCYVFGQPAALGPGWGMRIKKGGQVMFDSRHRYLRRVARVSIGNNGTLASGRTYASTVSNTGLYYTKQVEYLGGSLWRVTEAQSRGVITVSGTSWGYGQSSLNAYFQETGINPGASATYNSPAQQASILDVTDY
ncbi:MAG: hypothetical protein QM605_02940 [Sphingobium sp.]